jgi:electron transport complex protein RnfG
MKTMVKLSFVMAAYAVVACVGLAFVYIATAPRIAEAAQKAVNDSLSVVFPDATSFDDLSGKLESGDSRIVFERAYLAKKGDSAIGMVVQATGPTYKSSTILVGVDMNRAVTKVKFMANSDTPGLGTKTAESPFIDQFFGKRLNDAFAVKKDIAAISGATISSRGVAAIISLAGKKSGDWLAQNAGGIGQESRE